MGEYNEAGGLGGADFGGVEEGGEGGVVGCDSCEGVGGGCEWRQGSRDKVL